jgi:transcriptional regulator with XRE-family HTH domain
MSCKIRQQIRRLALEALRRARADAGLTISELAKRAGVARDTISNAERGHHSLQATSLHKVARALGKAPSDLLAEEERLAQKVDSRLSLEPSFEDALDDERRAAWEAAADEARRLRETGGARMWRALSGWAASKRRGEPSAGRRKHLDEMESLLQEVYDADTALGWAYIKAALATPGGSDAPLPSYLQEKSRTMSHFYGELLGWATSAGLSVRTGGTADAKRDTENQAESRPIIVREAG